MNSLIRNVKSIKNTALQSLTRQATPSLSSLETSRCTSPIENRSRSLPPSDKPSITPLRTFSTLSPFNFNTKDALTETKVVKGPTLKLLTKFRRNITQKYGRRDVKNKPKRGVVRDSKCEDLCVKPCNDKVKKYKENDSLGSKRNFHDYRFLDQPSLNKIPYYQFPTTEHRGFSLSTTFRDKKDDDDCEPTIKDILKLNDTVHEIKKKKEAVESRCKNKINYFYLQEEKTDCKQCTAKGKKRMEEFYKKNSTKLDNTKHRSRSYSTSSSHQRFNMQQTTHSTKYSEEKAIIPIQDQNWEDKSEHALTLFSLIKTQSARRYGKKDEVNKYKFEPKKKPDTYEFDPEPIGSASKISYARELAKKVNPALAPNSHTNKRIVEVLERNSSAPLLERKRASQEVVHNFSNLKPTNFDTKNTQSYSAIMKKAAKEVPNKKWTPKLSHEKIQLYWEKCKLDQLISTQSQAITSVTPQELPKNLNKVNKELFFIHRKDDLNNQIYDALKQVPKIELAEQSKEKLTQAIRNMIQPVIQKEVLKYDEVKSALERMEQHLECCLEKLNLPKMKSAEQIPKYHMNWVTKKDKEKIEDVNNNPEIKEPFVEKPKSEDPIKKNPMTIPDSSKIDIFDDPLNERNVLTTFADSSLTKRIKNKNDERSRKDGENPSGTPSSENVKNFSSQKKKDDCSTQPHSNRSNRRPESNTEFSIRESKCQISKVKADSCNVDIKTKEVIKSKCEMDANSCKKEPPNCTAPKVDVISFETKQSCCCEAKNQLAGDKEDDAVCPYPSPKTCFKVNDPEKKSDYCSGSGCSKPAKAGPIDKKTYHSPSTFLGQVQSSVDNFLKFDKHKNESSVDNLLRFDKHKKDNVNDKYERKRMPCKIEVPKKPDDKCNPKPKKEPCHKKDPCKTAPEDDNLVRLFEKEEEEIPKLPEKQYDVIDFQAKQKVDFHGSEVLEKNYLFSNHPDRSDCPRRKKNKTPCQDKLKYPSEEETCVKKPQKKPCKGDPCKGRIPPPKRKKEECQPYYSCENEEPASKGVDEAVANFSPNNPDRSDCPRKKKIIPCREQLKWPKERPPCAPPKKPCPEDPCKGRIRPPKRASEEESKQYYLFENLECTNKDLDEPNTHFAPNNPDRSDCPRKKKINPCREKLKWPKERPPCSPPKKPCPEDPCKGRIRPPVRAAEENITMFKESECQETLNYLTPNESFTEKQWASTKNVMKESTEKQWASSENVMKESTDKQWASAENLMKENEVFLFKTGDKCDNDGKKKTPCKIEVSKKKKEKCDKSEPPKSPCSKKDACKMSEEETSCDGCQKGYMDQFCRSPPCSDPGISPREYECDKCDRPMTRGNNRFAIKDRDGDYCRKIPMPEDCALKMQPDKVPNVETPQCLQRACNELREKTSYGDSRPSLGGCKKRVVDHGFEGMKEYCPKPKEQESCPDCDKEYFKSTKESPKLDVKFSEAELTKTQFRQADLVAENAELAAKMNQCDPNQTANDKRYCDQNLIRQLKEELNQADQRDIKPPEQKEIPVQNGDCFRSVTFKGPTKSTWNPVKIESSKMSDAQTLRSKSKPKSKSDPNLKISQQNLKEKKIKASITTPEGTKTMMETVSDLCMLIIRKGTGGKKAAPIVVTLARSEPDFSAFGTPSANFGFMGSGSGSGGGGKRGKGPYDTQRASLFGWGKKDKIKNSKKDQKGKKDKYPWTEKDACMSKKPKTNNCQLKRECNNKNNNKDSEPKDPYVCVKSKKKIKQVSKTSSGGKVTENCTPKQASSKQKKDSRNKNNDSKDPYVCVKSTKSESAQSSSKPEESCKKKEDPCKKDTDACKDINKAVAGKKDDDCKPKEDPCKSKNPLGDKARKISESKKDSCKDVSPPPKQEDPCKKREENSKSTTSKGSSTCIDDFLKKRTDPCDSKSDSSKKAEDDFCTKKCDSIAGSIKKIEDPISKLKTAYQLAHDKFRPRSDSFCSDAKKKDDDSCGKKKDSCDDKPQKSESCSHVSDTGVCFKTPAQFVDSTDVALTQAEIEKNFQTPAQRVDRSPCRKMKPDKNNIRNKYPWNGPCKGCIKKKTCLISKASEAPPDEQTCLQAQMKKSQTKVIECPKKDCGGTPSSQAKESSSCKKDADTCKKAKDAFNKKKEEQRKLKDCMDKAKEKAKKVDSKKICSSDASKPPMVCSSVSVSSSNGAVEIKAVGVFSKDDEVKKKEFPSFKIILQLEQEPTEKIRIEEPAQIVDLGENVKFFQTPAQIVDASRNVKNLEGKEHSQQLITVFPTPAQIVDASTNVKEIKEPLKTFPAQVLDPSKNTNDFKEKKQISDAFKTKGIREPPKFIPEFQTLCIDDFELSDEFLSENVCKSNKMASEKCKTDQCEKKLIPFATDILKETYKKESIPDKQIFLQNLESKYNAQQPKVSDTQKSESDIKLKEKPDKKNVLQNIDPKPDSQKFKVNETQEKSVPNIKLQEKSDKKTVLQNLEPKPNSLPLELNDTQEKPPELLNSKTLAEKKERAEKIIKSLELLYADLDRKIKFEKEKHSIIPNQPQFKICDCHFGSLDQVPKQSKTNLQSIIFQTKNQKFSENISEENHKFDDKAIELYMEYLKMMATSENQDIIPTQSQTTLSDIIFQCTKLQDPSKISESDPRAEVLALELLAEYYKEGNEQSNQKPTQPKISASDILSQLLKERSQMQSLKNKVSDLREKVIKIQNKHQNSKDEILRLNESSFNEKYEEFCKEKVPKHDQNNTEELFVLSNEAPITEKEYEVIQFNTQGVNVFSEEEYTLKVLVQDFSKTMKEDELLKVFNTEEPKKNSEHPVFKSDFEGVQKVEMLKERLLAADKPPNLELASSSKQPLKEQSMAIPMIPNIDTNKKKYRNLEDEVYRPKISNSLLKSEEFTFVKPKGIDVMLSEVYKKPPLDLSPTEDKDILKQYNRLFVDNMLPKSVDAESIDTLKSEIIDISKNIQKVDKIQESLNEFLIESGEQTKSDQTPKKNITAAPFASKILNKLNNENCEMAKEKGGNDSCNKNDGSSKKEPCIPCKHEDYSNRYKKKNDCEKPKDDPCKKKKCTEVKSNISTRVKPITLNTKQTSKSCDDIPKIKKAQKPDDKCENPEINLKNRCRKAKEFIKSRERKEPPVQYFTAFRTPAQKVDDTPSSTPKKIELPKELCYKPPPKIEKNILTMSEKARNDKIAAAQKTKPDPCKKDQSIQKICLAGVKSKPSENIKPSKNEYDFATAITNTFKAKPNIKEVMDDYVTKQRPKTVPTTTRATSNKPKTGTEQEKSNQNIIDDTWSHFKRNLKKLSTEDCNERLAQRKNARESKSAVEPVKSDPNIQTQAKTPSPPKKAQENTKASAPAKVDTLYTDKISVPQQKSSRADTKKSSNVPSFPNTPDKKVSNKNVRDLPNKSSKKTKQKDADKKGDGKNQKSTSVKLFNTPKTDVPKNQNKATAGKKTEEKESSSSENNPSTKAKEQATAVTKSRSVSPSPNPFKVQATSAQKTFATKPPSAIKSEKVESKDDCGKKLTPIATDILKKSSKEGTDKNSESKKDAVKSSSQQKNDKGPKGSGHQQFSTHTRNRTELEGFKPKLNVNKLILSPNDGGHTDIEEQLKKVNECIKNRKTKESDVWPRKIVEQEKEKHLSNSEKKKCKDTKEVCYKLDDPEKEGGHTEIEEQLKKVNDCVKKRKSKESDVWPRKIVDKEKESRNTDKKQCETLTIIDKELENINQVMRRRIKTGQFWCSSRTSDIQIEDDELQKHLDRINKLMHIKYLQQRDNWRKYNVAKEKQRNIYNKKEEVELLRKKLVELSQRVFEKEAELRRIRKSKEKPYYLDTDPKKPPSQYLSKKTKFSCLARPYGSFRFLSKKSNDRQIHSVRHKSTKSSDGKEYSKEYRVGNSQQLFECLKDQAKKKPKAEICEKQIETKNDEKSAKSEEQKCSKEYQVGNDKQLFDCLKEQAKDIPRKEICSLHKEQAKNIPRKEICSLQKKEPKLDKKSKKIKEVTAHTKPKPEPKSCSNKKSKYPSHDEKKKSICMYAAKRESKSCEEKNDVSKPTPTWADRSCKKIKASGKNEKEKDNKNEIQKTSCMLNSTKSAEVFCEESKSACFGSKIQIDFCEENKKGTKDAALCLIKENAKNATSCLVEEETKAAASCLGERKKVDFCQDQGKCSETILRANVLLTLPKTNQPDPHLAKEGEQRLTVDIEYPKKLNDLANKDTISCGCLNHNCDCLAKDSLCTAATDKTDKGKGLECQEKPASHITKDISFCGSLNPHCDCSAQMSRATERFEKECQEKCMNRTNYSLDPHASKDPSFCGCPTPNCDCFSPELLPSSTDKMEKGKDLGIQKSCFKKRKPPGECDVKLKNKKLKNKDQGLLRQSAMMSKELANAKEKTEAVLEEIIKQTGQKMICKVMPLGCGEKLVCSPDEEPEPKSYLDGSQKGSDSSLYEDAEDGVIKILDCTLEKDECGGEKLVCRAIKVPEGIKSEADLIEYTKKNPLSGRLAKVTCNKLVCREVPVEVRGQVCFNEDGTPKKEMLCAILKVEEIRKENEEFDCTPPKIKKKSRREQVDDLKTQRELKTASKNSCDTKDL